jgi:hypothetical protein
VLTAIGSALPDQDWCAAGRAGTAIATSRTTLLRLGTGET